MAKESAKSPKSEALDVAFVLDRSGSMSHLAEAVVRGVDEFVSELHEEQKVQRPTARRTD